MNAGEQTKIQRTAQAGSVHCKQTSNRAPRRHRAARGRQRVSRVPMIDCTAWRGGRGLADAVVGAPCSSDRSDANEPHGLRKLISRLAQTNRTPSTNCTPEGAVRAWGDGVVAPVLRRGMRRGSAARVAGSEAGAARSELGAPWLGRSARKEGVAG